jgi:diguanylate cyclase (GGDEF)-like protein
MKDLPLFFSEVFFAVSVVYGVFSVYILIINRKSMLNRVYFAICIALCIWSLGFAFATSAPNVDVGLFWRRFAAIGWGSVFAFILHFFLVLSNKKGILKKRWIYLLLYAPAAVTVYVFATPFSSGFVQYNLILTSMGWVNSAANNLWDWFYSLYYGSYAILGLALIWLWGRRSLDVLVKKQARLIFGSFLGAILVGTLTDMLFNSYLSINIPQLAPIIILLPMAVVNYSINHYGLMQPKPVYEEEPILNVSSRSLLYNYISAVAAVGSLIYIISGYIYNFSDMGPVYTFGLILLSFGISIEIIRRLKIKDSLKDIINISIIAVAIPVVTLHFLDNAALTIWAAPIIVIIFSLVFNKRYVLIILSVSITLTQIAVWILVPNKAVSVDGMGHIMRLVILGVSVLVAFYVNKIYIARLNENKQKMVLQEILSKISSDFVQVNETMLEGAINTVLEKCGLFTGLDRLYVMMFDQQNRTMTYRYEWCNEGVVPEIGSFYDVPFEKFPWLMESIWSNETLQISNIETLSPEAHFEMLELVSFDVCKMAIVPIRSKDKYFGFLAASTMACDKEIQEDHMTLLKVVSNILSGAFTRVEGERTVNEMAFYDHLTKLPNRSLFKDRVEQAVYLAQRTAKLVGIIFLDLDSFKNVNDTMGHEGGDELIKNIAKVLFENVRKSDTVSRFGGDEFLIMVNNLSKPEDIVKVADDIMSLFSRNFKINQQDFFVTASAGIALYPMDGEETETLVKNADIAMYTAKAKGKNQYVLCTEDMKQKVQEKMKITNFLFRALERNELMVYYQPQVSLPSAKVVGLEALLRWKHPEMGMIPPITFIPLAEQTGLINAIGEWVLKTACLQNKKWQQMGLPKVRVAVNVSVNQFRDPDMVEKVKSILEETGLAPEYLELEITESVAINESGYIINVLNNLKKLGISISIDDFGTEYSSLSRLKLLPIDRLKMDMQFVRSIEGGQKDQAIVKVIINLAKNLGIKVIAEGVETEAQKEFLEGRLCDEVQGYYYYRPVPADEIQAILQTPR